MWALFSTVSINLNRYAASVRIQTISIAAISASEHYTYSKVANCNVLQYKEKWTHEHNSLYTKYLRFVFQYAFIGRFLE